MKKILPFSSVNDIKNRASDLLDNETLIKTSGIVSDVKYGGFNALKEHSIKLGDIKEGDKIIFSRKDLKEAFYSLPLKEQELLKRVKKRISDFSSSQLNSIKEFSKNEGAISYGQFLAPVNSAGCYAPGGLYPLPSSILMTVCTAKVSGVKNIIACSPKPALITLGASYIAGADSMLGVGGAQAISALSYGTEMSDSCDMIVGPGNKWVTAAKRIVSIDTGIDMLAGPSELVVVADESSNVSYVASDLIAQAEHDFSALPVLVSLSDKLIKEVKEYIKEKLKNLLTKDTAIKALSRGASIKVNSINEAAKIVSKIAPEHLQLSVKEAERYKKLFDNYGAIFIGENSAEVLCDYGAGPNHVLPTCGYAKFSGGLSVFTFLRIRTWMQVKDKSSIKDILEDSIQLAELEGLDGHKKAAEIRNK